MILDTSKFPISDEQIAFYKSILLEYEPYELDHPAFHYFDYPDADPNRMIATYAKKFLTEHGISLDDEIT